jgi:hypothetical protein
MNLTLTLHKPYMTTLHESYIGLTLPVFPIALSPGSIGQNHEPYLRYLQDSTTSARFKWYPNATGLFALIVWCVALK